jgi:hypothetical protein
MTSGGFTVMLYVGRDVVDVPSLTEMAMPEYVPVWVDDGVPVSDPVAVLNIAQAGLLRTLKASVLPSASEALGVNAYRLPAEIDVAGVPEIAGAVLVFSGASGAVTEMLNAGNELDKYPSETLIVMFEKVPDWVLAGVPDKEPVLLLKEAHAGLFVMLNVSALPWASLAVGVKAYGVVTWTVAGGVPLMTGAVFVEVLQNFLRFPASLGVEVETMVTTIATNKATCFKVIPISNMSVAWQPRYLPNSMESADRRLCAPASRQVCPYIN